MFIGENIAKYFRLKLFVCVASPKSQEKRTLTLIHAIAAVIKGLIDRGVKLMLFIFNSTDVGALAPRVLP